MIPFRKMNGLGNEFIVVDARQTPVRPDPTVIARLADRTSGVGFDQFITMERSKAGADVFMRIDNADGGEVEACGNGTRCVGWLLMREGRDAVSIETRAGILNARPGASDLVVSVDMGVPRFGWREIPLAEEFADTRAIELEIGPLGAPILHSPSVANIGNPHAVFWVENDVWSYDLERLGPMLENHPMFPQRANITLAHVTAPDAVTIRTWERGVGLTQACGTAACATLVCGARTGRTARTAALTLPGGTMTIEWDNRDHVWMHGPVEMEFSGAFDPVTGAFQREDKAA